MQAKHDHETSNCLKLIIYFCTFYVNLKRFPTVFIHETAHFYIITISFHLSCGKSNTCKLLKLQVIFIPANNFRRIQTYSESTLGDFKYRFRPCEIIGTCKMPVIYFFARKNYICTLLFLQCMYSCVSLAFFLYAYNSVVKVIIFFLPLCIILFQRYIQIICRQVQIKCM